jgi:hypothetical protein
VVNGNNSIALTSASGTNAQTLCVNTAITNITYATTGATGATVSGLPAGVSGTWANNTVTISGTPTAAGAFNYTVTMTGGCTGGTNAANGVITVNTNADTALTDSICQGSYFVFGGDTLRSAGVYRDTLAAVSTCDSIVTLTLNSLIRPQTPSIVVSNTRDTLFASPTSGLRWFRNGVSIGTNGVGGLPIALNGIYQAVRDTSVGSRICVSDTFTVNITNVGVFDILDNLYVKVYPVPADYFLNIKGLNGMGAITLTILDQTGRIVRTETFSADQLQAEDLQLEVGNLAAGTYQMHVSSLESRYPMIRRFQIMR